jgi:hypothetical protein
MTTPAFNITAARKTLGAILHRIEEEGLDPTIRRRIIQRQIADLIDTVQPFEKYEEVFQRCSLANAQGDMSELAAGMELISALLPPLSYGCTLQGQVFRFPGEDDLWRKSKSGCVSIQSGVIYSHPAPGTPVTLVNI